jgi:hypothetical protein
MKTLWCLFAAGMLLMLAGSCVARPKVIDPGTERYKQARAQRFDPYPQNDMGPAVVGGRPRDFQNPPAEVLRVQPRKDSPAAYPPTAGAWQ